MRLLGQLIKLLANSRINGVVLRNRTSVPCVRPLKLVRKIPIRTLTTLAAMDLMGGFKMVTGVRSWDSSKRTVQDMNWMWLVVVALVAYHAWCFYSGRIRFAASDGVNRRTRWVYRDDNPILYWVLWSVGTGFTLIFSGAFLLQGG